jgi:vanillate O-demethylase monooxygenase subunit
VGEVLRNDEPALRRAWHPLCRSDEVTSTPSSHRLLATSYVAYRDSNGAVRVFEDRCPHRLAPLSLGRCEADHLRCGYHGWRFNSVGACVEIPALGESATIPSRAQLVAPAQICESHTMVFIAPEEPLTPVPVLSVSEADGFLRGDLPAMTTRGSAGLLADNFLDMAHFAFVHAGTFGADEEREVPAYRVERDGYNFSATYEHLFANREDPGVTEGKRPLVQTRRLTYRYRAPFHLELAIDFLDAGGTNVIGFFLVPRSAEEVTIYSSLWRNDLDGSEQRMKEAVVFEVAVVEEDLALQSRYERLELPLDLTSELHTRADKTTVELRRILADFVEVARG